MVKVREVVDPADHTTWPTQRKSRAVVILLRKRKGEKTFSRHQKYFITLRHSFLSERHYEGKSNVGFSFSFTVCVSVWRCGLTFIKFLERFMATR